MGAKRLLLLALNYQTHFPLQELPKSLTMENGASSDSKDPSGFLSDIIGAPVTVKLNSSVVYKGGVYQESKDFLGLISQLAGFLSSVDGYMNIALEKTEEYVNGELKTFYGDAFVRGNNGEPPAFGYGRLAGVLTKNQFCTSLRIDKIASQVSFDRCDRQ